MRYIFARPKHTHVMQYGSTVCLLPVPPDRPQLASIWCMSKAQQPRPTSFSADLPHYPPFLYATLLTLYVPTLL